MEIFSSANVASEGERRELCRRAIDDPEHFWAAMGRENLAWVQPFRCAIGTSATATTPAAIPWFVDGTLNVSFNCLDRHLAAAATRPCIFWEGEAGERRTLTYAQMHRAVCRLANVFKKLGVEPGDRVAILLPNIPEAVIAMQACARLGAVHAVIFAGFSAPAVRSRLDDLGPKVVVTANAGVRSGRLVPLKATLDAALAASGAAVVHVLVLQRALPRGLRLPPSPPQARDVDWEAAHRDVAPTCAPVAVAASHPLFVLYTSGSTGRPKGIVHASAGYALGAITSLRWALDVRPSDIYWCTADIGWITGHTYVAYGPLLCGATQVMFEGAPQVPDAGRLWAIAARLKVSIFYTAPTLIRALMQHGETPVRRYDLSALRVLGSVGEPINKEAWQWFYAVVGASRAPLVDTWWQTETGCIMMAPLPANAELRPGSCALPLPGVRPALLDAAGERIETPHTRGALVLEGAWPSMMRGIYNDAARTASYWPATARGAYVTGDSAMRDEDGFYWILGRTDDVLNVSGHRLSTMEVEAALCSHPRVAEAAAIGVPDPLRGEAIVAYVVTRLPAPPQEAEADLAAELRGWVAEQIGSIARPQRVLVCAGLPKTRSGKVMRRLLRSLARSEPLTQDLSTLDGDTCSPELLRSLQGLSVASAGP